MVDFYERIPDHSEALQLALDGRQTQIWTAQPAIVTKVSDLNGKITIDAQPAVQGKMRTPNGDTTLVSLPIIPDVPVVFPKGGGYAMTFPIAVNDEILVVHAARNIDGWWQNGGIAAPLDSRMHDLTDAFAVPGPYSQAKKFTGLSTTTTQLRTEDGTLYIEVDKTNKKVRLVSNAIILELDSTNNVVNVTGSNMVTVTAPTVRINGNLQVTGTVTGNYGGASVGLTTHEHGTGSPAAGTVPPTVGT